MLANWFAIRKALVSKHPSDTLTGALQLSKTSNCGDMIGVFRGDSGVYFSPVSCPSSRYPCLL